MAHPAPSPSALPRRAFLRGSAAAAAAATLPRFSILRAGESPNGRLNVACIGIGNRGFYAVSELMKDPRVNLVALCDVDQDLVAKTYQRGAELKASSGLAGPDLPSVRLFRDYREMFATFAGRIDAVTVSTPDHHHYPAAALALRHGKHVYVEKPLTHTVGEARALRAAAQRAGVITQMGNQGRATEGIRLMKEWVDAGAIGDVREVHGWSPAFNDRYFRRPPALPRPAQTPPATLDWDLWCGPAERRDYHESIAPVRWRGWWDFGCGMLGDWACHTLDAPFWALELGSPSSVEAQVDEVSAVLTPRTARVTFRFPARGARPPVTLVWHEGDGMRPPKPRDWEDDAKKPGLPERGMFMLGSRHTLYAPGGRPDSPRLLGTAVMEEFKRNRPAPTLPRVAGGPLKEWLDAIIARGPRPGSNFEYSVPLSEMVLLGVLAMRTGRRLEWDGQAGRITNHPELNRLVEISARPGWRV